MAGSSLQRKTLWQYSHSASVLFAVLLFLAGFLCMLLWTNGIVPTPTSTADVNSSTFTYYSPAVSTFNVTYNVAIFGTAWNTIIWVVLLVLERDDVLPLSTERLRYELEKAACTVSVAGNAIYSVACIALMAVLAQLAADQTQVNGASSAVNATVIDRRAGQGSTAAMAGLAAAAAIWACVMDVLHALHSPHRSNVKHDPRQARNGDVDAIKQA